MASLGAHHDKSPSMTPGQGSRLHQAIPLVRPAEAAQSVAMQHIVLNMCHGYYRALSWIMVHSYCCIAFLTAYCLIAVELDAVSAIQLHTTNNSH